MFIHDDAIKLHRLLQRNLKTGRVYQVAGGPDVGMVFPSITRVLKSKEQDGLKKWKARVGEAEAAKVSARATVQGTALHSLCERYLANLDLPPIYPNVMQLWQHIRPWLTLNITKVYQQEADLYSRRLGVAGRTDLLANVGDDLCVVDFKSASKEKKKEWIEDYFIQGTFYASALYESTRFKAKRIVLPIIHPEGLQLEEAKPMQYFDALMDRINHFYATFDPDADAAAAKDAPNEPVKATCSRCPVGAADEPGGLCKDCTAILAKPKKPFERPQTFKKIAS